MQAKYRNPSYPPFGEWDERLTNPVCTNLLPVEKLHQNEWFTLSRRGTFYTVDYMEPQVILLPVVDNEAIVMVRVKRPVLGDITLELPAGAACQGETPEAGAARELAEETGIEISDTSRLIPMPPLATSPNREPRLVYVFLVNISRLEFEKRSPHDSEVDSVELICLDKVSQLISTGGIYVAGVIAVISSYILTIK
jgi:8-oxo-dGTP pyrophosphatase MutT (NUDIX family)